MKKLFAILMALGLVGFMACSAPAEGEGESNDESAAVMDEMETNMDEANDQSEMAEEATESTEMKATEDADSDEMEAEEGETNEAN